MSEAQQLTFDGRVRLDWLVDEAIEWLRLFCPPEGYYLAFSGGKDSQCIYHLAEEAGVKFDAHYNQTGVDPPSLIYFMREHYPDVIVEPYEKSMWQLIKEHRMPPLRTVRFCCRYLKERGGQGRIVLVGVRAAESRSRAAGYGMVTVRARRRQDRLYSFDPEQGRQLVRSCPSGGKVVLSPIFAWTDQDVWAFIRSRNLSYCELYDEGFKRLGCIGCPMAKRKTREMGFARWPKFKDAYIRTFDAILADPSIQGRDFRSKFANGRELFDWWINDAARSNPGPALVESEAPKAKP